MKSFLFLLIGIFFYTSNVLSQTDTVSIVGVGDIMLGTDYPSSKYLHPSSECEPLLAEITQYLNNSDITFGNLEGVFAGEKGIAKKCNNPDQCYVFRMPVKYVNCIVGSGFDLISVANNHVNDFGYEGRQNTSKILKEAGLSFAGFEDNPYTILEKDSIKYGFCAFAPHTGTADLRNISKAVEIVKMLDSITDIVIVSFHAGAEGKDHQHVTREREYFYNYDRGNVYEFSHAMVDAGADIIFGHGPHVTRAMELYNDRLICYSLGNFCTYRRFNLSGPNGYAPLVKVFTNKNGQFLEARITPIYQDSDGVTKVDPLNRAVQKLKELTQADFPENKLDISEEGIVTIKNDIE